MLYNRRNELTHQTDSSCSHQALSAALCGSLCPSTRAHFEPAHCVWDGNVGSMAQHSLIPACSHPTTRTVPILLCFPPHMTALWWDCDRCLPPPVNPVSSSMIGHGQHGTAESPMQSMSTVFKGQRPETTSSADAFFSLCELGQQQEKRHFVLTCWQFWNKAKP